MTYVHLLGSLSCFTHRNVHKKQLVYVDFTSFSIAGSKIGQIPYYSHEIGTFVKMLMCMEVNVARPECH